MTPTFYIADDDIGIQNILKGIIQHHHLGVVTGMADNGKTAIEEILRLQPDVVLIDLLMPQVDGIGVAAALQNRNCPSAMIMISQVDSKEMISSAYQHGIDFFINKPINVVEVIAVIGNVLEKIKLTRMFHSFESAMQNVRHGHLEARSPVPPSYDVRNDIRKILAPLGIMGEAGCQDLIEMVFWMTAPGDRLSVHARYKLSDAYQMLQEMYARQNGLSINQSTIEQRVRRAIKSALKNLANLGIENYYDDIFVRYSAILFEFGEVRREMDFEKGKSPYGGKISVKKFVEGVQILLTENPRE
ncbi:MAG: DNA-binding domain-containing protein [Bacillota bacterium]|nr:DNA-binding domain-containing protein [Bacillota bacterium]MDW7678054.1 DNA-binding domain-containing protein [Bacillota bacterium]